MMNIETKKAYILHSRPYRETSLLLELFTCDHGRINVIAKGVRAPKAKARGLLQAFVPLLISCGGKGELLTLKTFEAFGTPLNLQGRRLVSGFYLNELLMRLLHKEDAHPDIFDCYQNTLEQLNNFSEEKAIASTPEILDTPVNSTLKTLQTILRVFEKNLLKGIGYALQLFKEVETGKPIKEDTWYFFDPERGPLQVEQNKQFEKNTQLQPNNFRDNPGLKMTFLGSSLLALANECFQTQAQLNDAKHLLRHALHLRLGVRPLETRKLLV